MDKVKLINAAPLADDIRKEASEARKRYNFAMSQAFTECLEMVNKAPAVAPARVEVERIIEKRTVWHDAVEMHPADGVDVVCVKQLKSGRRTMCIGHYESAFSFNGGWCVAGAVPVVLWTELPDMPEDA